MKLRQTENAQQQLGDTQSRSFNQLETQLQSQVRAGGGCGHVQCVAAAAARRRVRVGDM